jgi:hypothetical protein
MFLSECYQRSVQGVIKRRDGKGINYNLIPLGDCPERDVSVLYIAVTELWTYRRVQPSKPECYHEESNDHICASCISDIFPFIRLHGIGERNHRQAAKPEVFYIHTVEHASEHIWLVSMVTVSTT